MVQETSGDQKPNEPVDGKGHSPQQLDTEELDDEDEVGAAEPNTAGMLRPFIHSLVVY